jgi:hypothetical protein
MKVTVASWFDFKTTNDARRIVSISRGEPKYLDFDYKIWELCPSSSLLGKYKRKEIDEQEYTRIYIEEVEPNLDLAIEQIQDGDVLCCWEPEGKFCHRRIAASFLKSRGIEVEVK